MKAEIIYQNGKSYVFKTTKFRGGVPIVVTDKDVIEHCKITTGFSVTVINEQNERPIKKKFRSVVKSGESAVIEQDSTPKKKIKFGSKKTPID